MVTLDKRSSPNGQIAIVANRRTGAVIYRQGRCNQSEADAEGISISAYIHVLYGLLRQAQARDVLLIGCGGGTLATMLHHAQVAATVIDIDPAAFNVAREFFKLPREVTCVVADGETFLRESPHRYDAIVLDAYIGTAIPPQFMTVEFMRLARARLNKSRGCLFANAYVVNSRDRKADRLATAMAAVFPEVRLLDERGSSNRNAIAMAGAVAALEPPTLIIAPKTDVTNIARTLARMRFRTSRRVA